MEALFGELGMAERYEEFNEPNAIDAKRYIGWLSNRPADDGTLATGVGRYGGACIRHPGLSNRSEEPQLAHREVLSKCLITVMQRSL